MKTEQAIQTTQPNEEFGGQDSVEETVPSLGDILSQERITQGLSEQDAADKLHITVHYLRSIETDKYEKLPGDIFARGYIKSYAILLGLEPQDLLEKYSFFNTHKMQLAQAESRIREKRKNKRNMPWVILSIIVFVAGFLGLWLFNSFFAANASDQSLQLQLPIDNYSAKQAVGFKYYDNIS